MSDENKTKRSITVQVDSALLERIEVAILHVPPGWDMNRVFEVGATELLERLDANGTKGSGSLRVDLFLLGHDPVEAVNSQRAPRSNVADRLPSTRSHRLSAWRHSNSASPSIDRSCAPG